MQPWRPNSAVMAAAATRASGSGLGGGPWKFMKARGGSPVLVWGLLMRSVV